MVGIAGIPGSGKTTFSQIITKRLNARSEASGPSSPPPAAFLPMDGFHLSRAQLDGMPDPANSHARRGAAFTFDAAKFLSVVQKLRESPISSQPILAPSFDHAVKDPKEDDIAVAPAQRIVVVEGNYVALKQPVWEDAAALFDELWFVEVGFDVARERLASRHVRAGIVTRLEDGYKRADENDLVNGREIVENRMPLQEVIVSKEDNLWVHE